MGDKLRSQGVGFQTWVQFWHCRKSCHGNIVISHVELFKLMLKFHAKLKSGSHVIVWSVGYLIWTIYASVSYKHLQNSGDFNRTWIHDYCNLIALLYQLSYEADFTIIII